MFSYKPVYIEGMWVVYLVCLSFIETTGRIFRLKSGIVNAFSALS